MRPLALLCAALAAFAAGWCAAFVWVGWTVARGVMDE